MICAIVMSSAISVDAHTLTTTHYNNNPTYINNFPQTDAIQTP